MVGYIYYLKCPLSNEIRYVGQTILKLQKRLRGHIQETRRSIKLNRRLTHKENWIRELIDTNKEDYIKICLIEECDTSIIDEKEIYWIKYYKSGTLTNLALGGKRNFLSEESKRKISFANKGDKNGMFGKRRTKSSEEKERTRLAMINSEKFQKSRKSDEYRRKISLIQQVDDWLLLDINFNIINTFTRAIDLSKYLGCTKVNVLHSRKDMRMICKKYWTVYKKDYDRFLQIQKNLSL